MKQITIYTDGACKGNPGPGGWAALLLYNEHEKVVSGAEKDTTNNRMELTAAIEGLKATRQACVVDLYTDSQYLQKGVTQWLAGWKRKNWKKSDNKPVKNADLWQLLDEQIQNHDVRWHWVKGHSGHPQNDRVDQLANDAIDQMLAKGN